MNKRYYKEIGGKKTFFSGILIVGDMQVINPTSKMLLDAGWMVYEDEMPPEPSYEEKLVMAKQSKIEEIESYDNSSTINGIVVGGRQLWIPAEQRSVLKTSIEAYKALGANEVTKVWEGVDYTFTVEQWLYMINTVEVYASECYNVTARHKSIVADMENLKEIESFDVSMDYPEMPTFEIENIM